MYFNTRERIINPIYRERWLNVLTRWFRALEYGVAQLAEPDLSGKIYSKEECDFIIKDLDAFFEEVLRDSPNYWHERNIAEPPEFDRLKGGARLAFCQDLWLQLHSWPIEDI